MDLKCNMRIYLWKSDESDLKKDGTYCKYCKKCRDNANEHFWKNKDNFNTECLCGCGSSDYKRHCKRHISGEPPGLRLMKQEFGEVGE